RLVGHWSTRSGSVLTLLSVDPMLPEDRERALMRLQAAVQRSESGHRGRRPGRPPRSPEGRPGHPHGWLRRSPVSLLAAARHPEVAAALAPGRSVGPGCASGDGSSASRVPPPVDQVRRSVAAEFVPGPLTGKVVEVKRPYLVQPVQPPRAAFAGFRFPPEVILISVRWYLRYGLSYRDLEELLAERGIEVDHVTLFRWVQRST